MVDGLLRANAPDARMQLGVVTPMVLQRGSKDGRETDYKIKIGLSILIEVQSRPNRSGNSL